MKVIATVSALVLLAGCGVDGAPERPEGEGAVSISVSGTAEVGVSGGSG